MKTTSVLVTGAGGSAAENVVDSLRRAGHGFTTTGIDASPVRLHLSSADHRHPSPRTTDPGWVEFVRDICRKHSIDVILPQPDGDLRVLGGHRDEVGAATHLPEQRVLELVADKEVATQHFRVQGVAVPESAALEETSAGDVVADLLGRHDRVWIRARSGAGSRAALPVRSADQALGWIRWWAEERGMGVDDFMASEFLPGTEFAYQSVWQDGELVAGQARSRIEYLYGHLTPSGQTSTPAVAATVDDPAVDDLACAAIRSLTPLPHGVFCVDMKQDAAGQPKVTEVNAGRFFTTSNFFAAAGLNMPELAVRCALGERPARLPSSPLPAGLHWIRMVDMGYALVAEEDLDAWPCPRS